MPPDVPVFLYHCRDDKIVPFAHLSLYARELPQATIRAISEGGHQLGEDLTPIARDIESLAL
jgi:pimeloyl-ACP methyl ester carboxylesterase